MSKIVKGSPVDLFIKHVSFIKRFISESYADSIIELFIYNL